MSASTTEELEKLLTNLPLFISTLRQNAYNIGVDSYCTVQNLLIALAAQGMLPADFNHLRTLIAPVLCCSEQEQTNFKQYFDDWLQALQPPQQTAISITEELIAIEQEEKCSKKAYWLSVFFVVLGLGLGLVSYNNYLGELIGRQFFEKLHPLKVDEVFKFTPKTTPPEKEIPQHKPAVEFINVDPEIPPPTNTNLDTIKFALWTALAVLALTLLWYVSRYAQLQRFLKRHSVLQAPELSDFFLKNQEQSLYSSVAFARTAQQLHKHRSIDAQYLDVAATVKLSIQNGGFYTPVYKAVKALPEYLVLINRASFNDQLSLLVASLLKQLDDFGLFIERYHFNADPRRCYSPRHPTLPYRLEQLQSLYPNHRLIIFADSRHFLNPVTGKLYDWLAV